MVEKYYWRISVIRLSILVEGQTEFEFVRRVLGTHLYEQNIYPHPILLGGGVSYQRLVREMTRLSWNFDVVSSLVDYYGFQGAKGRSSDELERLIETEVRNMIQIKPQRQRIQVIPYIQEYEFEGLLFSDTRVISEILRSGSQQKSALSLIESEFRSPEEINDSPHTAPSKRLSSLFPSYNKPLHGPEIASEIGLDGIRRKCPRFDRWVARLEILASSEVAGQGGC